MTMIARPLEQNNYGWPDIALKVDKPPSSGISLVGFADPGGDQVMIPVKMVSSAFLNNKTVQRTTISISMISACQESSPMSPPLEGRLDSSRSGAHLGPVNRAPTPTISKSRGGLA